MKTLYLHVGHGKTGSSYLQSAFANSIDSLAAHGIKYPSGPEAIAASRGAISSGNGYLLEEAFNAGIKIRADKDTLFSSEFALRWLWDDKIRPKLKTTIDQFDRLSVLLFVRDPVSHAASSYQQSIKRGGHTWTIEEMFQQYDFIRQVNMTLDAIEKLNADVTVHNFSVSRDVITPAEQWLGIPKLKPPLTQTVNRSMTAVELEFQRQLNRVRQERSGYLSDSLCHRLPNIKSDDIRPSTDVQEALWDRLAPEIERVNARVPASERYDRSRDISAPSNVRWNLRPAQIRVIVESLFNGPPHRVKGSEPKEKRIFFCHIPKTGGTTLRLAIEASFPQPAIFPNNDELAAHGGYPPVNAAIPLLRKRKDEVRLFRGHYHYSLHRLIDNPIKIVVLREPIARSISYLKHLIASGRREEQEIFAMLERGEFPDGDNQMTRFLIGSMLPLRTLTVVQKAKLLMHAPIPDADAAIEEAKSVLESVDILGLTEHLDLLEKPLSKIGVSFSASTRENSAKIDLKLNEKQIETIREHNKLDSALYTAALKKLGLNK